MNKRKVSLTAQKLCRFCLSQDDTTLSSMYDRSRKPKNGVNLDMQILSCVSVEVFPSDGMPSYICECCRFFMGVNYQFKQLCRQADENIMQYVQNGETLQSITWPPKLLKIFRSASNLPGKESVKRLVTEGGACIEVTSQDQTETDDEDDDEDAEVYNIKIGTDGPGGSNEGLASIKVLSASDKLCNTKNKTTSSKEPGAEGQARWPCPQCECVYPLQQLLQLHLAQKHRQRNVPCDQCDEKFFSKHDMQMHKLTHSEDTPFQCVACGKKFKRLTLLNRHEKNIHADLPQHPCQLCPATYLSVEELEAHQQKHINNMHMRHDCKLCGKKFPNPRTLRRHMEMIHRSTRLFACEYCPQRFPTGPRLAKHVRTHAGSRTYPCKFCDKRFLKSHHHTRHVRIKHKQLAAPPRAAVDVSEEYRCEQCDETFATKHEVIYHSAVHVTKNFICPLCKEKFKDADSVTVHIESHVQGVQYMCEACSLVFTSQEKLNTHMEAHHEVPNDQTTSQDEGSIEENEEEEEDDGMSLKDEGDHMLVQLKLTDDFMLPTQDSTEEDRNENSEDNDTSYTEMAEINSLAVLKKDTPPKMTIPVKQLSHVTQKQSTGKQSSITKVNDNSDVKSDTDSSAKKSGNQAASILRKAEEIKRQSQNIDSNEKSSERADSGAAVGTSDKSLRLLEKELQELKRTSKPAGKPEIPRGRRPQLYTSTPKTRMEEKKSLLSKTPIMEKRRGVVTKENKESKEIKDTKNVTNNGNKEEKESKDPKESKNNNNTNNGKEDKETIKNREENDIKEQKEGLIKDGKNAGVDKSSLEDSVRRSNRASKVKDYAKMIRDQSSEEDSDDDEEYMETDKPAEIRGRVRRAPAKVAVPAPAPTAAAAVAPAPAAAAAAPPKKRGRPRKACYLPSKIRKSNSIDTTQEKSTVSKEDNSENKEDNHTTDDEKDDTEKNDNETKATQAKQETPPSEVKSHQLTPANQDIVGSTIITPNNVSSSPVTAALQKPQPNTMLLSQTLKKVPMKSLPPGVKPLPLPVSARQLCEMQIGKKVVKVQKIVLTKAEVDAMTKKGLVEMKDGTIVLKQGIKLPTNVDPIALKSSLIGDEMNLKKESPGKKDKAQPTRCHLGEDNN